MIDAVSRRWRYILAAVVLVVFAAGAVLWVTDARPAVFTPFDGGMGTDFSPWEISSAEQLVAIDPEEIYLDGSFVLVDDVDFDDVDDEELIGVGSRERPFSGSFDGDGHTIEKFSVQATGQTHIGLFRRSGGTIEAVEMVDVDIRSGDSSRVGSLVGSNWGEVREVYANGNVEGRRQVGGLVGRNMDEAKVVEGEASGDVEGERSVGGLVGSSVREAKVLEGAASGDVEGESEVGGLVGLNSTGIGSNSGVAKVMEGAASGDVEGESEVGGLVGRNWREARVVDGQATGEVVGDEEVGGFVGLQIDASIARSYSTGPVDGDEQIGGFAGKADDPDSIEHAYWNVDTSGVGDSAGGVGLTDEEFADPENFEGFVFCPGDDCRWVMDEDQRRPVLEAFAE